MDKERSEDEAIIRLARLRELANSLTVSHELTRQIENRLAQLVDQRGDLKRAKKRTDRWAVAVLGLVTFSLGIFFVYVTLIQPERHPEEYPWPLAGLFLGFVVCFSASLVSCAMLVEATKAKRVLARAKQGPQKTGRAAGRRKRPKESNAKQRGRAPQSSGTASPTPQRVKLGPLW